MRNVQKVMRKRLEDLGLEKGVILKWLLMRQCRRAWCGFVDYLSDCWLLKLNSVQWSYLSGEIAFRKFPIPHSGRSDPLLAEY
jgi:hypothetical protein